MSEGQSPTVPAGQPAGQPEPQGSTPQRLYLHIGLPKSGSTHLQSILGSNRVELQEHGFVYPWVRQEGMFHAAVEMAGDPSRWGLDPEEIKGTFAWLLRRGRRLGGVVVISHEIFSAATEEQVEAIVAAAADFEVHVVMTVRDLGRTVSAEWQERIKNGAVQPFSFFYERVLDTIPAGREPDPGFLPSQNLALVLDRWRSVVPPDRTHIVPCPPPGAARDLLWRRFAGAIGLSADAVDVQRSSFSNESLGTAQLAFLRRVLRELDGELEQPWHSRIAKRWFAQRLLGQVRGAKPVTPAEVVAPLVGVAERWNAMLVDEGYRLHGDLEDLVPALPDPPAPPPDDVSDAAMLDGLPWVVAQMLLRVRDLNLEIQELEKANERVSREKEARESRILELEAWGLRPVWRRLRRLQDTTHADADGHPVR